MLGRCFLLFSEHAAIIANAIAWVLGEHHDSQNKPVKAVQKEMKLEGWLVVNSDLTFHQRRRFCP